MTSVFEITCFGLISAAFGGGFIAGPVLGGVLGEMWIRLPFVAARQVDEASQGQLQGILSSATSLASIFAPLGFSGLYFITRATLPGAVWLSVLMLYILAVPLIYLSTRTPRQRPL